MPESFRLLTSTCDPTTSICPTILSAEPGYFQGYDQPLPLKFTFAGAVTSITVTGSGAISCSGTWGILSGYDAAGLVIGSTALRLVDPDDCSPTENPDNVTFGATGTLVSERVMSYAILTPMNPTEFPVFDLVGHASQTYVVSVDGAPSTLTVKILEAGGPNDKSFTLASAERKIALLAEVTPSDPGVRVVWEVLDAPGDRVDAIPPSEPIMGLATSFMLPRHDRGRWPTDHPGASDRMPIAYKVTATAEKDGQMVRSEPVTITQDLIDTIREEYYEFGLASLGRRIPGRMEFWASPMVDIGVNNGDYPMARIDPTFAAKLSVLKASWKGRWQINTIYRNPVHNLNGHIKSKSKPSNVSWHMWGCAADLQTFPTDHSAAQYKFWHALADLAQGQGWDVEPLSAALVGHVHVELNCP